MTPAKEDALVERFAVDCFDNPNCDDVRESFRLAIRAAVAAERERCAKRIENRARARHGWDKYGDAAAIREGEK